MPACPPHISWFIDSGDEAETLDGRIVKLLEFKHIKEKAIISAWAKHFREQYCLDRSLDELRLGTGLTRAEYLTKYVFPDKVMKPGPSIRSGDFAEILIADYLQF